MTRKPLLKSFMGEVTPEIQTKLLAAIPLGRFSTREDMGHAAMFLRLDAASMVADVCMEVDGGRSIEAEQCPQTNTGRCIDTCP